MPIEPPPTPHSTSKIPRVVNRQLRDYETQIESHRYALHALRGRLVEDIEENEAVLAAMKRQLRDIDRTLHTVPGIE